MLNKIQLIGRLGKDPEILKTQNGTIAKFSVATSEYREVNGERKELTEWHNIVAFGKNVENVERLLKKGRLVYVEGKSSANNWTDKDGNKRYGHQVIVSFFKALEYEHKKNDYHDRASSNVKLPQEAEQNDLPF